MAYSTSDQSVVMRADGGDFWNESDRGYFIYEQQTGDFDVSVRMAYVQQANEWTKAVIMVRKTAEQTDGGDNSAVFFAANSSWRPKQSRRPRTLAW